MPSSTSVVSLQGHKVTQHECGVIVGQRSVVQGGSGFGQGQSSPTETEDKRERNFEFTR